MAAPDFVHELAEYLRDALKTEGVPDEKAAELAIGVASYMTHAYGGEMIYIPLGRRAKAEDRWRAIFDEYNGKNVRELALKHGMTIPSVYRVLNEERNRRRAQAKAELLERISDRLTSAGRSDSNTKTAR